MTIVSSSGGQIVLHDAAAQQKVPIAGQWHITDQTPAKAPPSAEQGRIFSYVGASGECQVGSEANDPQQWLGARHRLCGWTDCP